MENGTATARDPSSFLSEIIGNAVTVKLNSGVVYKGTPNSKATVLLEAMPLQTTARVCCADGWYRRIAVS